jgi:UDP-N-acetylglucosamine 2-epimerase (non-hydrolysing)
MVAFEKDLVNNPCDLVLVVGDVTSTMACAIVARKSNIRVAHIEAGIRSFDNSMPEEINRLVTDSITNYFFTTSKRANENLLSAGIESKRIFFVGNVMIDTLLKNKSRFFPPNIWHEAVLENKKYVVLTLHRPSNVDNDNQFELILTEIMKSVNGLKVVFPVHPRTRKKAESLKYKFPNLWLVDPLGYLEFNYLVENAIGVVTDSGGITEETTVFGIPCITLRENTERPETVEIGTNLLIGNKPDKIGPALNLLISGNWKRGEIPEFWDGKSAERIIDVLISLINE